MGLWWEWSRYTLPSGKTIDDVKNLIATNTSYGLPSLSYTDIKVAADVLGEKKVSLLQWYTFTSVDRTTGRL